MKRSKASPRPYLRLQGAVCPGISGRLPACHRALRQILLPALHHQLHQQRGVSRRRFQHGLVQPSIASKGGSAPAPERRPIALLLLGRRLRAAAVVAILTRTVGGRVTGLLLGRE